VSTSFGTQLSGTWALFNATTISLPLAQIVLPATASSLAFDFEVNIIGFSEERFSGFVVVVPEPSSFAFLALIVILLGAKPAVSGVILARCENVSQS
jgi:hypothetical protein